MQELTADRIIMLLEEPTENGIPVYRRIRRHATVRNLVAALASLDSFNTREPVRHLGRATRETRRSSPGSHVEGPLLWCTKFRRRRVGENREGECGSSCSRSAPD